MQLILTLYGRNARLPAEMHRIVHGMIYRALSVEPAFSARLHEGSSGAERAYKGFTFGALEGDIKQVRDGRYLDGYADLEIRSCDADIIDALARFFSDCGRIRLGSVTVEVEKAAVSDRKPGVEQADVTMLSPAVAYITDDTRHTTYFSPNDEQFFKSLQSNAARKARHFLRLQEDVRIEPLFSGLPRKEFVVFKGTYINAWYGRYRVSGSREMIDLLYDTGLGAKNSEGFGMFELLSNRK